MDGNLIAWRVNRILSGLFLLVFAGLVVFHFLKPGVFQPVHVYGLGTALPLLAVLHAVLARASRLRQPWARVASLVMGCLLLVAFPIGTLAGIFLIFACASPWPALREHDGIARGGWHQDGRRR